MRVRGTTPAGAGTRLGAPTQLTAFGVAVAVVAGLATVAHADHDPTVVAATASPSAGGGSAPTLSLDRSCLRTPAPTTARFPASDPYGTAVAAGYGGTTRLDRLYGVTAGRLVALDGVPGVSPCDAQVWTLVQGLAGPQVASEVDELMIVAGDPAASSRATTSAATGAAPAPAWHDVADVRPLVVGHDPSDGHAIVDPGHWRLTLDLDTRSAGELAFTIAHELGHLDSLGPRWIRQVDPGDCTTWAVGAGCPREGSPFAQFLLTQWSERDLGDWSTSVDRQRRDTVAFETTRHDYYGRHRDDFVDEYATTAPTEDYAETFAAWCLLGTDEARTVAGAGVAAKVDWFAAPVNGVADRFTQRCARLRQLVLRDG